MKTNRHSTFRATLVIALMLIITIASSRLRADSGSCGGATVTLPFTDVMGNPFFCEIAEAFFSGLTNGTTPTTYSPTQNVTREQMAALITRTMDQSHRPNAAGGCGHDADQRPWAFYSRNSLRRSASLDGKRWRSVSIVTLNPLSITTVTAGFNQPLGILYDGANMWVTDQATNKLFKLDSNGAIIQTVDVGTAPQFPVFDGTNIWVPNNGSNTVTVVRASTGSVLATLTGNGLISPNIAFFDGERILVTNFIGNSVSLWKAADLTPLGSVSTGSATSPVGACSDGLNFWITLLNTGQLARF